MADEKPRRGCSQRMGCVVPALALALLCGGFGFLLGTAVGTDIPAQVAQIAVSDLVDMDMPSLTVQPGATARQPGTPTPSSPSAVPTSAGSSSKCQHNLAFIRDVTIPDDTPMEPGAAFQKTWAVRNAGNCAWAQPLVLKFTAGEKMNAPDSVAVPPAKPGEACEVSVPMKAPAGAGTHYSEWRLCAGGECYGPSIYMQIVTKGTAGTATPKLGPSATPKLEATPYPTVDAAVAAEARKVKKQVLELFAPGENAVKNVRSLLQAIGEGKSTDTVKLYRLADEAAVTWRIISMDVDRIKTSNKALRDAIPTLQRGAVSRQIAYEALMKWIDTRKDSDIATFLEWMDEADRLLVVGFAQIMMLAGE